MQRSGEIAAVDRQICRTTNYDSRHVCIIGNKRIIPDKAAAIDLGGSGMRRNRIAKACTVSAALKRHIAVNFETSIRCHIDNRTRAAVISMLIFQRTGAVNGQFVSRPDQAVIVAT